jgi:hypothetical protein
MYKVIAPEDSWSWVVNEVESGLTGTYQISGSGLIGKVDVSLAGQVLVQSYYDAEMKKEYIPTYSGGGLYLGSEWGYIVVTIPDALETYASIPIGLDRFYFGWLDETGTYEADVREDRL